MLINQYRTIENYREKHTHHLWHRLTAGKMSGHEAIWRRQSGESYRADIEILSVRGTGQIDCPFSQDKAISYNNIYGSNQLPPSPRFFWLLSSPQ